MGILCRAMKLKKQCVLGILRSILFYVYTRYPHRSLVDIDNLSDKVMWNGLENRWLFLIFNQERILKVA